MHKTLPDPLKFVVPGVMPRPVKGKEGKHARIPVANPVTLVSLNFILDVETPTGGAEIGAGAAVET